MRILVTRPEREARRTAEALRALGHQPVLLPLVRVVATGLPVPHGTFEAIVATSANAFTGVAFEPAHRKTPLHAVGPRTAEAARHAGFLHVNTGAGAAAALVSRLPGAYPRGAAVLFLAGTPRKPEIETALAAAGMRVTVLETYRAVAVDAPCPEAATTFDAVLHYSRASAEKFAAFARKCGLAGSTRHLCLSPDVALGLNTLPKTQIFIAERPDETSLFALLNTCCSGPAG